MELIAIIALAVALSALGVVALARSLAAAVSSVGDDMSDLFHGRY